MRAPGMWARTTLDSLWHVVCLHEGELVAACRKVLPASVTLFPERPEGEACPVCRVTDRRERGAAQLTPGPRAESDPGRSPVQLPSSGTAASSGRPDPSALHGLLDLLREVQAVSPQQGALLVELLEEIALGVATVGRVATTEGLHPGTGQYTQSRAWERIAAVYARLLASGGGS